MKHIYLSLSIYISARFLDLKVDIIYIMKEEEEHLHNYFPSKTLKIAIIILLCRRKIENVVSKSNKQFRKRGAPTPGGIWRKGVG